MSEYDKKSKMIRELANPINSDHFQKSLERGTEGMTGILPHVSQGLQILAVKALNYLDAKMPKAVNEFPGDPSFEPTKSQQRQWLEAHKIVENPVSALDHVRHGTLTSDHMDALSQVHPELLNEMREKVMEHMDPQKVKKLPMSTKASLSQFLGSPVTESILPQAIMTNQMAMQTTQPQGPQGTKTTEGGLKQLNLAKRAATETTVLDEET